MSVLRVGEGRPVTVFAPPGRGTVGEAQAWDIGLRGTRVFFDNGSIRPWTVPGTSTAPRRPRCEADRDAEELLAVADQHQALLAVGVSRGARAILGALAGRPDRFHRVVLIVPPGGRAAGRYRSWLESLPTNEPERREPTGTRFLAIGRHGEQTHPARVARDWAERLNARLELFPSGDLLAVRREQLQTILGEFLGD